ncbi:Exostosin-like [Trema orientale]|uniref:Exostosin-like n=1 Tax=Trema orientale TaxID=63057 RepID=A0A2P5ERA4_TREOI|nr:Exostosin-like [Trema orientale]
MESDTHFRTRDPEEAHVYFLPFSVVMIVQNLFYPIIRDKAVLQHTVVDHVYTISHKYRYWNIEALELTGPRATWYVPQLYNSIRVLCNANISEHLNPKKDASFPEINLRTEQSIGLNGGFPLSNRTILGFFAGGCHGRIRPALLQHRKDKDLRIYENLPEGISYEEMLKKSKFCI